MPFQEPADFRDESQALHDLLAALDERELRRETLFKSWTIDDVVRHLHLWNVAADESVFEPEAFAERKRILNEALEAGRPVTEIERQWHDGLEGKALLEAWRERFTAMADRWAGEDPKRRVQWAGPDMSLRSSITARLMETWSHGQEVYDVLGVERTNTDRIRGIVVLGVNTYGWTFVNRGLEPPKPVPHVRLTAPSGAVWTFGEPSEDDLVEGSATEFCQTVTQVRNVDDTSLRVLGDAAKHWMEIAQCFAGPPEQPPAPGVRRRSA